MTLARARRIGLYLISVAVLYAVVTQPVRSAEFAELAFTAVAGATEGVADLLSGLR
jgi:Zn-dependent membrane protease YugP